MYLRSRVACSGENFVDFSVCFLVEFIVCSIRYYVHVELLEALPGVYTRNKIPLKCDSFA